MAKAKSAPKESPVEFIEAKPLTTFTGETSTYTVVAEREGDMLGVAVEYQVNETLGKSGLIFRLAAYNPVHTPMTFRFLTPRSEGLFKQEDHMIPAVRLDKLTIKIFDTIVSPADLLNVAQSTGLIDKIALWLELSLTNEGFKPTTDLAHFISDQLNPFDSNLPSVDNFAPVMFEEHEPMTVGAGAEEEEEEEVEDNDGKWNYDEDDEDN